MTPETEIKKDAASEEKALHEKFDQRLKATLEYTWKERDEFIKWLALFAVWAMYFSLNLLIDNRKANPPYLPAGLLPYLEASAACFFISLVATVFYKWRWSVKYVFDVLELENLEWQTETEAERLEFIHTKKYENFKKSTKAYVRMTELIYKAALGFFVAAFLPLFFAVIAFLHPRAMTFLPV